ncbi:hypothetical protein TRAPUB_12505 [Trametes pubescens]|uniref:C2H2-type domain-containing protein n=1 Tax=Trametes pubescens TaxID=154538 RepID=A0A1M2VTV7_TRAPU|nr:hypothetical protein TRAPUB_12505 [Trametes pubescens]
MSPPTTYDDYDVAALLFAVGALEVPGLSISSADLEQLGEYLGPSGKLHAICAHYKYVFMHCTLWEELVANMRAPISAILQPIPSTPSMSAAEAAEILPPTPPHARPSHAPAITAVPTPHTFAATQSVASSSTPRPPSAKALGKRKAAPESDVPAAPEKKTRTAAPLSEKKVVCQWESCGQEIVAAKYREHLLAVHWPDVQAVSQVTERQECKWEGGCRPDPRTKNGFPNLTALFKHLMDHHFKARNQPCPTCHVEQRPDRLRQHIATCGKKA